MGTKYPGTAAEILALDAYIKLTRAAASVLDRTNGHLAHHKLTTSQFGVLEALYHLGTLTQVEVARKLLMSTGNLTTVLQNLERRGLVQRARNPDDQRYVRVTITAAGQALVARILPAHVAGITADLAVLSADEQRQLGALCRKLGRHTKDE